jgi:hypothetical protein
VVVISPSAVHSARMAVTTVVHSFMTLFWAMAPHFRVGRFAYFPHDVYVGSEIVDRRPWRVDRRMNTTRMGATGAESSRKPAGGRRGDRGNTQDRVAGPVGRLRDLSRCARGEGPV